MSERKVLNKYYPPDFDPLKIPRAKGTKNRQFTVRLMAPCNMRCTTCGEYIYKGKKFNARKEDVENDTYLGIRIYRFYIKCTRCLAEISFKTDPEKTDYIIEAGATRNFMALKIAEEQAAREEAAEKEDDATNPMKVLEKRTQASRHEMAALEALEELKELNQRLITPDHESLLSSLAPPVNLEELEHQKSLVEQEEAEDEAFIQSVFGNKSEPIIKRLHDSDSSDEDHGAPPSKISSFNKPTDTLLDKKHASSVPQQKSIGMMTINKQSLVKTKTQISKPTTVVKPPSGPTSSGALSLLTAYGSDSDSN